MLALKKLLQRKDLHTWDVKETNHLLDRYGFTTVDFKEDLHIACFLLHSQATDLDALVLALHIQLPESFMIFPKNKRVWKRMPNKEWCRSCRCLRKRLQEGKVDLRKAERR